MCQLSIFNLKQTRSLVVLFFLVFLNNLYLSEVYAGSGSDEETQYDLMLVGGGLNTCSSFSLKNCQKKSFNEDDLQSILYQISPKSISRFLQTEPIQRLDKANQENIRALLLNIYAKAANEVLTRSQLRDAFENNNRLEWYQALPDPQHYALLDSLEVQQLDQNKQRKQEKANLLLTKDKASVGIYQRFVQQAKLRAPNHLEKPHVVVITASSRDPFEVADFYTSVFEQAGAKVTWLPLDKTYQQARALETAGFAGCEQLVRLRETNLSFYRERIYPQRTALQQRLCAAPQESLKVIQSAQGIFFNGGDQSLTLAALKLADGSDSAELALIKTQVNSGALIVGGTSAGTAVHAGGSYHDRPIVMLTNGDPAKAMSRGALANPPPSQRCLAQVACGQGVGSGDLTYRAQGGTGLFDLGLLDTHFSERDRESRLAVFTASSEQAYAFGVDEATALLVDKTLDSNYLFEVQGANGVFIVDQQVGHYALHKSADSPRVRREVSGVSHYLAHAAQASFSRDTATWQFKLPGELRNKPLRLGRLDDGEWRNQIRAHCGSTEVISWQQYGSYFALKASQATVFHYEPQAKHCHYTNLPFVISYLSE